MSKERSLYLLLFVLLLTLAGAMFYFAIQQARSSGEKRTAQKPGAGERPTISIKFEDRDGQGPRRPPGAAAHILTNIGAARTDAANLPPVQQGQVSGVVQDAAGRPIVGATLDLVQPPNVDSPLLPPLVSARSAEDGRYRLSPIAFRGEIQFDIRAKAPGFAWSATPVTLTVSPSTVQPNPAAQALAWSNTKTSATVNLVLEPSQTLRVRVVDANDAGIAGAQVKLLNQPLKPWRRGVLEDEGVTDAEGQYEFVDQSPGKIELHAQAESYIDERQQLALLPHEALDKPVLIKLDRAQTLAGRAIDGEGQPLAGVKIAVQARADSQPDSIAARKAVSDAEGRWRIEQLRSIDYLLTAVLATSADSVSAETPTPTAAADSLRLEHHQYLRAVRPPRDDVELVFIRGGQIRAKAVDKATGRPLPEVLVQLDLLRAAAAGQPQAPIVRCRAPRGRLIADAGAFLIQGLPSGSYCLRVEAARYKQLTLNSIQVQSPTQTDLGTLELESGAGLVGRVISSASLKPQVGVTVLVRGKSGSKQESTDAHGRFQFLNLKQGTYQLTCGNRQGASRLLPLSIDNIEFPGDELLDLGDLTLEEGRTITGTVTDSQGQPVANARVEAHPETTGDAPPPPTSRSAIKYAVTDKDGRFSIAGLEAAPHLASCTVSEAHRKSYAQAKADLTSQPTADVALVIDRSAFLQLRIAAEPGVTTKNNMALGYLVGAGQGTQSNAFSQRLESQNELNLTDLTPGEYLIVLTGRLADNSQFRLARLTQLKPGDNALDFRVANQERQGIVLDKATGEPLAAASVNFQMELTNPQAQESATAFQPDVRQIWLLTTRGRTDAAGRFTLRGLQNQRYFISVMPRGSTQWIDIDVIDVNNETAGGEIEIKVPLETNTP